MQCVLHLAEVAIYQLKKNKIASWSKTNNEVNKNPQPQRFQFEKLKKYIYKRNCASYIGKLSHFQVLALTRICKDESSFFTFHPHRSCQSNIRVLHPSYHFVSLFLFLFAIEMFPATKRELAVYRLLIFYCTTWPAKVME